MTYAEEDGKKIDISTKADNIPTNNGFADFQGEIQTNHTKMSDSSIVCSFPKSSRGIGSFNKSMD